MDADSQPIAGRWRGAVQAGLLALGSLQLALGAYALIAPRSFFDDFPFGRGWVAALPAYSEHLVRDVGSLFLVTAVILIAAGVYMQRRLVVVALVAFLVYSVPHTVFHLFNLEPYEAVDVVANVLGLAATVLVPIALLVLIRRDRPGEPASPGGPGGDGPGRVDPVPESSRNPLVRYAYRASRKATGGTVLEPLRVFAHNPTVLAGYGALEMATERSNRVPARLKHLATLRAAMLCGCEWCLDYGSAVSPEHQVDRADLEALPAYERSERFSSLERAVLDYATAMSRTPVEVSDELFAAVAERLDAAALVELTNEIALENYRARFNWAFGLGGQGFSEGAHCLRPEILAPPAEAIGAVP